MVIYIFQRDTLDIFRQQNKYIALKKKQIQQTAGLFGAQMTTDKQVCHLYSLHSWKTNKYAAGLDKDFFFFLQHIHTRR